MELVYTIEYGHIDKDYEEEYCENELHFISKTKYTKALKELLQKFMLNIDGQYGNYIECYIDEMELTNEDYRTLNRYNSLVDCSPKNKMAQKYIIKNYTEVE